MFKRKQIFFDGKREYDVETLWHLTRNSPIKKRCIQAIISILKLHHKNTECLNEIIKHGIITDYIAHKYPDDVNRIRNCDLNYPILIQEDGNYVLDGYHRVCRLIIEGRDTVRVKFVSNDMLKKADIINIEKKVNVAVNSLIVIGAISICATTFFWLRNRN